MGGGELNGRLAAASLAFGTFSLGVLSEGLGLL